MSEEKKDDKPKTLSLGGKLSLKGGAPVRPALSSGNKTVAVEVKRRRSSTTGAPATDRMSSKTSSAAPTSVPSGGSSKLSDRETEARKAALERAKNAGGISRAPARTGMGRPQVVERPKYEPKKPENRSGQTATVAPTELPPTEAQRRDNRSSYAKKDNETSSRKQEPKSAPKDLGDLENRRMANLTVTQALNRDYDKATTGPSLSSVRRRRKNRQASTSNVDAVKQFREVTLPETITVQELANRMTERAGNVIKSLMKMGVMATVNQSIDADTAELIIIEFGHSVKRVTDADVEIGIEGEIDDPKDLKARPPVVTIMGHVDHGKTSLLDAFRQTNVVAGEAGGITQHIGAYQIKDSNGDKITFLDTPGHAAFTEMRARGANVTDIVIIVVAANDSLKPQTIEALQHAKAAEVPMIIAINKIDLSDANPQKVMTDLLSHEVIVEQMGGDVQCVEVSAKHKTNLDKLEEAILLQAELLELKANPNRNAVGRVVEAKVETGRGSVATVLVQKGTLKIGDIFVCGAESGRVRALINDQGKQIKKAEPSLPVEVLGLQGTPQAGDDFVVVEDDTKARKIADYRARKIKESSTALAPTSAENFFAQVQEGEKKELTIVVKGDVHGSTEAIVAAIDKLAGEQEEVKVRTLLSGVGAITESDVTLAGASKAIIIGFNVRANAQARQLAEGNGVTVKYYNVIYNILDDMKGLISGLFAPIIREEFIGNAKIKEVFNITKVGKIAGCMVTEGFVKRGAKVRLLRDDVVIHEGTLKTLKRHKDEVKEVKEGTECGMAFENYEDIRVDDVIECFDVITEQKTMD